jgi:hypothetical protein
VPAPSARTETPLRLTAAGLTAVENYDPQESPANFCEADNVPATYHSPYQFEITIGDQEAVIYHESYNVTRTVPLASALAEPTGVFGMVSGRVDGNELVVESNNYRPGASEEQLMRSEWEQIYPPVPRRL